MVHRRGEWSLVLVLTSACSPALATRERIPEDFVERYAAARCEAASRCACDPSGWVNTAMCTGAMHSQLDERVAALRDDDDVTYDPECFDALLAFWASDDACDPTADVPYCVMVDGDGAFADPCSSMATHGFSASSCGEGLYCSVDGECSMQAPTISVQLGEPCDAGGYACVDGTFCDLDAGVCSTKLTAGNPCAASQACDAASWCAGLGGEEPSMCVARAAEGEACESTSAWDGRACLPVDGTTRYCVDGTCTFEVASACGPWL